MPITISRNGFQLLAVLAILCSLILPHRLAIAADDPPPRYLLENNVWSQLLVPANASASTVDELFREYLPRERYGQSWIVFRYDGQSGTYRDPGLAGTIKQGEAFWIVQITGSDRVLSVPVNVPTASTSERAACAGSGDCASIALATSNRPFTWSLVGSPFRRSVPVSDIRIVTNGSACEQGCSISAAADNGLIGYEMQHFDEASNTYIDRANGNLEPWEGVWVYTTSRAQGTNPVMLIPRDGAVQAPPPSPLPAPTTPTPEPSSPGIVTSDISAFHRSGQTFITWAENNAFDHYHVYRHVEPISMDNLGQATRLTNRWGPIDSDSSRHVIARDDVPQYFVIQDFAGPLTDTTALFVNTTQPGQGGDAWYAITRVEAGNEVSEIYANVGPIAEGTARPRPVQVRSINSGKGRLYTQFMDYTNWNPTHSGYAYNFAVSLPFDFNPSTPYALQIQLHAYGENHAFPQATEFNQPFIQVHPHDPRGFGRNILPSWWYGYSDTYDYRGNSGGTPDSGSVVNYTEQRVMDAVRFVLDDSGLNIDKKRVYASGHSMGASGALALGIRYGNLISGVYASEPMTNYATDTVFKSETEQLWGRESAGLGTVHRGSYAGPIQRYNGTNVWNWMNHPAQIRNRQGDDMAYLITDFGKQDTVIQWSTQGKPIWQAFNEGRAGFAGITFGSLGHSWLGFAGVVDNLSPLFGMGFGQNAPWRYPLDMSYVSISYASGSGGVPPSDFGDDQYNQSILWSTPWFNFHQPIEDSFNRYAISLRSTVADQTADITPKRTQSFNPAPGTNCSWQANSVDSGAQFSAGSLVVDGAGLAVARSVPILSGAGIRLVFNC